MSYEIYFIKKTDFNAENIGEILEAEASEENEHFISQTERELLTTDIHGLGIKFEIFANDNHTELNAQTYQVSIFNSQIAISIPYWDENQSTNIDKQLKEITNLLIEKGYTGFDPQTEQIIKERYEFKKPFTETKKIVDEGFQQQTQATSNNLIYIGLGIGLGVVILIIWVVTKK